MSYNPDISFNEVVKTTKGNVYPVYILSRVVAELIKFCKSNAPEEALAYIIGHRITFPEKNHIKFTKITDWVTGSVQSSHISAQFNQNGLQQVNLFLDERYGKNREKNLELPSIIGIVHSHPFGFEPQFSITDLDTFLNFPYDTIGNVFVLIDPIPNKPFFKVFKIIVDENQEKKLQMVPWVEYTPIQSDFKIYKDLEEQATTEISNKQVGNGPKGPISEQIVHPNSDINTIEMSTSHKKEEIDDALDDPLFNPPKIEKVKPVKKKKKNRSKLFD
ncbi:MAG: Mov34/MPN/PAD-1 family protein [Candidatus Hodarchaeales archaeon]|jgi:hypothetical protein